MYPRKNIQGFHTLRVDFDPPKFEEIQLPNGLLLIVDSDHARDMRTRKSCHHLQALVHGVALDWKHFAKDRLQAGVGALARRDLLLEEFVIRAALDLDEIGRFDYLFKFSEIETVGHGCVLGVRMTS